MAKLCYVETEDWAFGTHRMTLGKAALAAGHSITVVAPAGELMDELRAEGFEFESVPMQRTGLNPLHELRTIGHLVSLLRRTRPDIVHNMALKPALYGSIAARIAGVPAIVNSITGLGYVFIAGGTKRRVLRTLLSRALRTALSRDRVRTIFQNPDDRDFFVEQGMVARSRTVLIRGSGVDTSAFAPAPEAAGDPVVVLASRMLWDKGVGELVEAARILRARDVQFTVQLAGLPDPDNPASIPEETLTGWHAEGIVQWVGYVHDMPRLLAAAHIGCLPSYREGLPRALLEAAAAGLPVVGTDVPGCREVVQHGDNGLLVPARDATSLADALQRLISDADERRRMGAHGRERVLRYFSDQQIIGQILGVYDDLLGEATERR